MNILDIQDSLKDLSEAQLIQEMQMPSGTAPQFLVLGEIQRRKRVRDDFASQQAQQQQTVAQEAVAAMGIPQAAGMDMQQAMNPNRSMVQNAPSGGIADIAQEPAMKMNEGGLIGGLFANTERGRNITDVKKDYEIRTGKDGKKLVYRAGTNIFLGTADKFFGGSEGYMEGGILNFAKGGDMPTPTVMPNSKQKDTMLRIAYDEALRKAAVENALSQLETDRVIDRSKQMELDRIRDIERQDRSDDVRRMRLEAELADRQYRLKGLLTPPDQGLIDDPSQGYMEGGVLKFAKGGDTLGIRNMNPGNIRPGAKFFGETGSESGYATFKSPAHGLRAMARLFQTYKEKYGIDTIDEFVDRYAPAKDNDEKSRQNYKQFLADALGVGVDDEVDLVARSADLIPAVTKFENSGNMPYSDDMVSAAIKSSSVEDEAEVDSMLGGFQTSSAADFSTSQATETDPSLLNKLGIVSPAAAATLNSSSTPTSDDQMKLDMIEAYRTSDDPDGMDAEATLKEIIRDTENNSSRVRVAAQQALNEIVSPKPASTRPAAPVQTDAMSDSFMDETFSQEPAPSTFSFMDLIKGDGGGFDPSNLAGKGGKGTGTDNPNNPLAGAMGSSNPFSMIPTAPEDPYNIGEFGEVGPPPERSEPPEVDPLKYGIQKDAYRIGDFGEFDVDSPQNTTSGTTTGSSTTNQDNTAGAPVGASTMTQGNAVGMPGTTPMPDTKTADSNLKFGSPDNQVDATTSTSSDLMAEIDAMRAKLDKDRESDKWLALAQAGMALMSSTNPTMMGALGEAGMSGLKALRSSEAGYDEGVAQLLSAKAKLIPKPTDTALTQSQAMTQINQITELLNKTVEVPDPTDPTGMGKKRDSLW